MEIKFPVPGRVKGKSRPRFARMGKFTRTYSAESDVLYENLVKMSFLEAVSDLDTLPKEADIKITVKAYAKLPKSAKKSLREDVTYGLVYCTKKPDIDNILKIICDSLNGVAYDDDKQVVEAHCSKYWHPADDFVFVHIEYVEGGAE